MSPLFAILCSFISVVSAKGLGKLLLTQVVFRHGHRTPLQFLPSDPYQQSKYWPVEIGGQLLPEGLQAHFELGKWLRARYSHFLSQDYNSGDVYVQSTDVDRTLIGAQYTLAGLYEKDRNRTWDQDVSLLPIPIHYIQFIYGESCPRIHKLAEDLNNLPILQELKEKLKVLEEVIGRKTGITNGDYRFFLRVADTIFIEESYGLQQPDWIKEIYPEPLKSVVDFVMPIAAYTPEMARLSVGPFVQYIWAQMYEKVMQKSEKDRKMFLYSNHDITISNLMEALLIYNGVRPPYVAALIFELRKGDDDYFVTIFYRNSSTVEPHQLTIPGCDAFCPFETFTEIVGPLLPEDWHRECELVAHVYRKSGDNIGIPELIAVFAVILIVLVILVTIYLQRKYKLHS